MIGYINGKILDISQNKVILETGGVGYTVHTTLENISKLKIGSQTEVWVYTAVRENDISLYGFGSQDEKRMFELLLSVSGIGPKSALTILGVAGLGPLENAISSGETLALTKISGIGKKTAEKIVLELGGKVLSKQESTENKENVDVFDALKSLGYRDRDISESIKKMPMEISGTNQKIKWLLTNLSK